MRGLIAATPRSSLGFSLGVRVFSPHRFETCTPRRAALSA